MTFRISELFIDKRKIQATGSKWTAFTPSIAVIIDPSDKLRVLGELLYFFLIYYIQCTLQYGTSMLRPDNYYAEKLQYRQKYFAS